MASSSPTNKTSSSAADAPKQSYTLQANDLDGPHEIYLVILNTRKDHIVVRIEPDEVLALPVTRPSLEIFEMWQDETEKAENYLEKQYGVPLRILRPFIFAEDRDAKPGVGQRDILVLELFEDNLLLTDNHKWMHRHQIHNYTWEGTHFIMTDSTVKNRIEFLFEDINNEPSVFPLNLAAWRCQGWMEHITSWVRDAIRQQSFTLRGPIRACAHSFPSVVLKCEAGRLSSTGMDSSDESETLYIKAGFPEFNEVAHTEGIARVLGPIVPEVIAVDKKQGVMIMRDAGHVEDYDMVKEYGVNTIMKIQTKSLHHLRELKEAGLEVRDWKWLSSNIESILNHPAVENVVYIGNTEENTVYLRSRVQLIQDICSKMNEWKLPNVLVHGDAHSDNFGRLVSGEDKGYRLFDWANSFIGPPMLDAYMMDFAGTWSWEEQEGPTPSLKQFGKLWESFVPAADLPKAIEQMRILLQAISLYRNLRLSEMADAPHGIKIDQAISRGIWFIAEGVKKHDDKLN